jgi:SAM-dependent methyltransferase
MTLLGHAPLAGKETLAATYDPLAPHYDAYRAAPGYEEWLAGVLALAVEHGLNGRRALDVGCGTGRSLAALRAAGFEVSGTDPSSAMLERARTRLGDDVELGVSALPEPLPAGPDVALITAFNDVLNYVEPLDLDRAVASLAARLAPGGLLLFDANTPIAYATFGSAPHLREAGDSFFAWSPSADDDATTFFADLHAFTPHPNVAGAYERSVSRHVQHLHRHERVVAALQAAGLDLVTTRGAHDAPGLDPYVDESVHIKRIYLARLP